METLYLLKPGKLYIRGKSLVFKDYERNKRYFPIEGIEKIVAFSPLHLTYEVIKSCLKRKINIYFFNSKNSFLGLLTFNPFSELQVKQYESLINNRKKLFIAKSIILAMYENFRYYFLKKGIKLKDWKEKLLLAKSVEEIMGYESQIWKEVYDVMKIEFKDFEFNGRIYPAKDEVNALISFLNVLLYNEIYHRGVIQGFNMDLSYLHSPKRGSLSFDIAEIYKPLITIPIVFKLVNKRMVKKEDFEVKKDKVYMKKELKALVIKEFKERLEITYYVKRFKRKYSLKTLINYEFYNLRKWFDGGFYKPFIIEKS